MAPLVKIELSRDQTLVLSDWLPEVSRMAASSP
jgi:hypothetical protein